MSGGAGSRLWPLSSQSMPKQFIPLFQREGDQMESILQRNARLMLQRFETTDIFISSGIEHVQEIRRCLPWEPSIIVEPERRDTFPSICLSSLYLMSVMQLPEDELVCFCPADLYVDHPFVDRIADTSVQTDWSQVSIALLGIQPTEPLEKYGYIIPKGEAALIDGKTRAIERFVEKPSKTEAAALIAEGALWNSGVFIFPLSFIKQYLQHKGYPITYQAFLAHYKELPKISFDYEVLEKTERAGVISFEGCWSDIGSWDRLIDTIGLPHIGNAVITKDTGNVHVINTTPTPVICMGVSDLIVVLTEQGCLVTSRDTCDDIKSLLAVHAMNSTHSHR